MHLRRQAIHELILVCLILTAPTIQAAPPNAELQAAKAAFLKDFKRPDAASRAIAIKQFAKSIHPSTAELLIKRGFHDESIAVREATLEGLRQLVNDEATFEYLLNELKKTSPKPGSSSLATELLRALAAVTDPSKSEQLVTYVDELLDASQKKHLIAMTAIDEDGQQGDADSLRSALTLAKAKEFSTHFGYRRCVIQAVTRIRQPEAVDFLINLVRGSDGLIQFEVIQYLTRLTGQQFQDDDREWTGWWKENRATFQFPAADVELPEIAIDEKTPTYYGIPICAKRVVFVLDVSLSMRGERIDAAKKALLETVKSLPEQTEFDVVMFASQATPLRPALVAATERTKQVVSRAIIEQGLAGGTASNAALNRAFTLDPEVIYFLSDGEPTDGAPAQIIQNISQKNRLHRVSIHTIGVIGHGGIGLTQFMEPLATRNYGTFRVAK